MVQQEKQNTRIIKLLNEARKFSSKGKNQDAINTYWKILEIDSYEPYAYLELGDIYRKLKIYDQSIEMLTSGLKFAEKELDKDTLCNYYCILTEVYSTTNQQGLANKTLIKAAEIAPKNPMPRKILGDIYLKNNRIANAAKAYKKALELDPYYEPASKALGELTLEYGNQMPKEDKDKDYIKKVAVKLKDNNQNKTKPTSQSSTVQNIKPKVNINLENNDKEDAQHITQSENSLIKNNRPLPLDPKELAKIKLKPKNPKMKPKAKPQTAEDIEKAIKEIEMETTNNSSNFANQQKLIEENERNIDKYLTGDASEKEEAINYFIKQGKEGLSEIEELIYNPDPNVRILAIRALPLFNDYKNEVKSILQDASDDNDPEVIEEINKALNLL